MEPAAALVGDIAVPAVKGICQRGALLAAIAEGESELRSFGHAADTDAALEAVRALGAEVAEPDETTVRITGRGLRGLVAPPEPIDCGNAGTVLRLLSGIVAGQNGRFHLIGDESLSRRPVRTDEPLGQMGAKVETTDGHPPVTIEGAGSALSPIRYELPVASAQLKSAVLLAGLLAQGGPTTVVEPVPSRDHTERLLRSVGLRIRRTAQETRVWPAEKIPPLSLDIPGDFSSAAPFVVAATLLSGSNLRIHDVDINPTRTGLLDVLERMGARIAVFNRHSMNGEPVADLEVRDAPLLASSIEPDEVPRLVDELPLFALAASHARGESVVKGAQELRVKETDRIETVTNALRPLGIRISATDDGFRVRGVPARPRGGSLHSRGDHRIAMLGAVAGLASIEGVEIEDAEAVAVSFPGFFELLDSVTQR
ncbi:MAG TPA: 3-phosphoshikimate 1-carboxyvinyltransferase [Gaiellaceae bacterium]|nr:3-phosphoshikimate 1-carboxyvinyltransferase [Gaiellaceae bacterium]